MQRTRLLEIITSGLQEFGLESDLVNPILTEAEDGSAPAQFIVGSAVERSCGATEAIPWYQLAARQGYQPALERLRRLNSHAA